MPVAHRQRARTWTLAATAPTGWGGSCAPNQPHRRGCPGEYVPL